MLVNVGLIYRDGREIGIVTNTNEYSFTKESVSYEEQFDLLSKLFLMNVDEKIKHRVDSMFEKDYTLENGYVVYLRLNQKKIAHLFMTFAKFVEAVVVRKEDIENIGDSSIPIIDDVEPIGLLLNGSELSYIHSNPMHNVQKLMDELSENFKFQENKYYLPPSKSEKNTYFNRKKQLRFLGR